MHALVAHDDTVAHADSGHHHRRTASRVDASLYRLRDLVQMDVARDNIALGGHHRNQWAGHLFFRQAQRVQQRPMGRAVRSLFDLITYHCYFHLSMYIYLFACWTSKL